jgi:heme/copper-type cytochrome/quinol oxidase subunit 2
MVRAHLDQETTFRISSSESVHGIASDELGIPKTVILPNKITEVSFTPKKIGTYVLHCLIVCGPGHEDMMLTVQVVP